jgi:RimJ/RimL family protein N-acetyltransferase
MAPRVRPVNEGEMRLRRAVIEDCDRIFRWRNHPSVRRFSGNRSKIDPESHQQWFRRILRSRNRALLVAVKQGEDVGVIRFDLDPDFRSATMSIYVNPRKHHLGIGTEMMKAGEAWLRRWNPSANKIVATVSRDNVASLKLFGRAGFKPASVVFTKDL